MPCVGFTGATEERVSELIAAGVDVFRLNAAHGTWTEHAAAVERIRRLAGERPVAILLDLAGPKLRLAARVRGRPGEVIELELPATVRPGDPVLLADGRMLLEVIDPRRARVVTGGDIPAGKGINLPSSRLELPALTDRDRADLARAGEHGVDVVALSFVGRAADVEEAKAGGLPVIAKIERAQAVEHRHEIVGVADGVMVARGDLGVEIPIEREPVVQKELIGLANARGKPVITATQMLLSMVESPLPTRAEASDVANAVLDGTDAVMLSEETAVGRYPVEAVRVMQRIPARAEPLLAPRTIPSGADVPAQIAEVAAALAGHLGAGAIVVVTRSGFTARQVARLRPRVPVIALTPEASVRRQLSLVWGVTAVTLPWYDDAERLLARLGEPVRATGLVAPGTRVVVTASWPLGTPGVTNFLHVTTV